MKKNAIKKSSSEYNLPFILFTMGLQAWTVYLSFAERGSFKIGGEWLIIPLLLIGKNLLTQIVVQVSEDAKELKGFLVKNTRKPRKNLIHKVNSNSAIKKYPIHHTSNCPVNPAQIGYIKNSELQSKRYHLQAS